MRWRLVVQILSAIAILGPVTAAGRLVAAYSLVLMIASVENPPSAQSRCQDSCRDTTPRPGSHPRQRQLPRTRMLRVCQGELSHARAARTRAGKYALAGVAGVFCLVYRDRVSGHGGRVFVHTRGGAHETGGLCAPEQQYGADHATQERTLEAVSSWPLLGPPTGSLLGDPPWAAQRQVSNVGLAESVQR